MYLLSITINVEEQTETQWLDWTKKTIETTLANSELVHEYKILKLLSEELVNGCTYSFQYQFVKEQTIDLFEHIYNEQVAMPMHQKYNQKFVEFRTRLIQV